MKLRQFQQHLKKKNIGVAFFTLPDITIAYFTQCKPSFAYLLITPQAATFYYTSLDKKPTFKGITAKPITKHWFKAYKRAQHIGINKRSLTVAQLERLKKLWPHAKFVDLASALDQLRQQKTAEEVDKIQKACQITSTAFAALLKELELPKKKLKLKTELEAVEFLEGQFRVQGAEPAFPTIVAMGKNAAIPHHLPDNTKLTKGFLVIDFGAKYQQYCADMTRTVYLGKPTKKEKEFYDLLLSAQQDAIKAIEENVSFQQLDKVARKKLGRYSKNFTHSLGHGLGLEVHEAPTFSDKKAKVEEGMVFTVEPGVYFPGKRGIRIEDTLVWKGKVRMLTTSPKELITIEN